MVQEIHNSSNLPKDLNQEKIDLTIDPNELKQLFFAIVSILGIAAFWMSI